MSRQIWQPQYPAPIDWSNPITRKLAFAFLPSAGHVNLVNGKRALNVGGPFTQVQGENGIGYLGSGVYAEYAPNGLDISGASLTLFSIWESKPTGYSSLDGTTTVLSTRTSGNGGWTWGRNSAATGGASGNVTSQMFTLQAVQESTEANATVPSQLETPVAVRNNAGTVSWFANGKKSSADTSFGAAVAGGNIVLHGQGPYSGPARTWGDKEFVVLAFARALTDAEIASLSANPWQVFKAPGRKFWFIGSSAISLSVTENASAADSISAALQAAVAAAESVTAAETIAAKLNISAAVAESGSAADVPALQIAGNVSTSETATAADAAASAMSAPLAASETATAADAAASAMSAPLAASETATGADAAASAMSAAVAASETVTAADTAASAMAAPLAVAESAAAADVVDSALTAALAVSETATAVDAQSAMDFLTIAVTEAASAADISTPALAAHPAVAEMADAVDSVNAGGQFSATVAEVVTAQDSQSAGATMSAGTVEVAAGVDNTAATMSAAVAVAENAAAADHSSVAANLTLSVVESASAFDTIYGSAPMLVSVSELGNAADLIYATVRVPAPYTPDPDRLAMVPSVGRFSLVEAADRISAVRR